MRNSGNYFRWPARPFATAVAGARGKRRLVRFGVHAIRMLAALCVFLAISVSPARNALAEDVKESLAPKIVQEMQCGAHKVVISCTKLSQNELKELTNPSDGRADCGRRKLRFISSDGKVTGSRYDGTNASEDPPFGALPSLMTCGKAKGGRYYVEVQYSLGICPICEFYVLFTDGGAVIAERPASESNPRAAKHYDRTVRKLGIRFPETY